MRVRTRLSNIKEGSLCKTSAPLCRRPLGRLSSEPTACPPPSQLSIALQLNRFLSSSKEPTCSKRSHLSLSTHYIQRYTACVSLQKGGDSRPPPPLGWTVPDCPLQRQLSRTPRLEIQPFQKCQLQKIGPRREVRSSLSTLMMMMMQNEQRG